MRKKDFFIFDLDGTLFDSRRDITDSIFFALIKNGIKRYPWDQIYLMLKMGSLNLMEAIAYAESPKLLPKIIKIFRDFYSHHLFDHSSLYPGVKQFLESSKNIKKVIWTIKDKEMAIKILKKYNINDYIDEVVGGDAINIKRKPDPSYINLIMEGLGIAKEKAIMIGDTLLDIKAAKNLGVKICCVSYGFTPKNELIEAGADYIIDEIGELVNFLNK